MIILSINGEMDLVACAVKEQNGTTTNIKNNAEARRMHPRKSREQIYNIRSPPPIYNISSPRAPAQSLCTASQNAWGRDV